MKMVRKLLVPECIWIRGISYALSDDWGAERAEVRFWGVKKHPKISFNRLRSRSWISSFSFSLDTLMSSYTHISNDRSMWVYRIFSLYSCVFITWNTSTSTQHDDTNVQLFFLRKREEWDYRWKMWDKAVESWNRIEHFLSFYSHRVS